MSRPVKTTQGPAPAPARAPRHTLNRDLVVAEAMRVADAQGLDALTIRALATHLGVKPMALYHHVKNKDALLDELIERVFTEIELPDAGGAWRAELTRRARSMRDVLVQHPWAVSLLDSRTALARPATLIHHEAVLATLASTGCSASVAVRAYALLDSYVYGFVLQEVTLPDPEAMLPLRSETSPYPHLRQALATTSAAGYAFAEQFDDGLEVVLSGIEGWVAA